MLPELEQIAEQIHPLKELEWEVAQQLGMSQGEPKDVDEVLVLLKVKSLRNGDDLAMLWRLHCLRLQYSRAQLDLPVELKAYLSPPGVSRNHWPRNLYLILIGSLLASMQCRWISILRYPYWHQRVCILSAGWLRIRCTIDGMVLD